MPERNEELMAVRLAKLQRLRERGIDPYPAHLERTHSASEAVAAFVKSEADGGAPPHVVVAGRITLKRPMGKATFLDLRDGSGKVQIFARVNDLGEEQYTLLEDLELG